MLHQVFADAEVFPEAGAVVAGTLHQERAIDRGKHPKKMLHRAPSDAEGMGGKPAPH